MNKKTGKKIKVAVLMGGISSETEVSLASGKNVVEALKTGNNLLKYTVVPVRVSDPKKLLKQLEKAKPDVIFSVMHGTFGEDGTLQALLDVYGVPYVGSGVLSSALCMDKKISAQLVADAGIVVPKEVDRVLALRSLGGAWVVKPRASGSSVGVTIVKDKKDLAKAIKLASMEGEPLVQEYISGTELTCGVMEDEEGRAFALPVTEIIPKSNFFDYKAKYTKGGSEEITPARISPALTREVQRLALLAHKTLGCRHISRSDFILKGQTVYYLETNTCPGMTNTSLVPQAARVAGIDMPTLVHRLLQSTLN